MKTPDSRQVAKAPIFLYQAARGNRPSPCRYFPSCSNYGLDAIDEYGAIKGWMKTLVRIARCNPFGGWGMDPVPTKASNIERKSA